jgi:hypothetical protein
MIVCLIESLFKHEFVEFWVNVGMDHALINEGYCQFFALCCDMIHTSYHGFLCCVKIQLMNCIVHSTSNGLHF